MSDVSTSIGRRRMRSVVLVDFDNVYLGLQKLDVKAAEVFARDPAVWLASLADASDEDGPFQRRFLVKKCYLNPAKFSAFRPAFTRAGFQVVDCPSLTQQGKSSADINLVLDAVDALSASTRFDEFVLLSADADFTPLVARCRAADRSVTVVTSGPAAVAYRAVADIVVSADEFVAMLVPSDASNTDADFAVTAPMPPTAGASSKNKATERSSKTVRTRPVSGPTSESASQTTASDISDPAAPAVLAPPLDPLVASRAVRSLVESSAGPVPLSTASNVALSVDPGIRTRRWDESGSFIAWLLTVVPDLPTDSRSPGYVWDPRRFSEADLPESVLASARLAELTELQRQIVALTEIPALDADAYRALFEGLAFDLAMYPFDRNETPKRVRDESAKTTRPLARTPIAAVITGLQLAGAPLSEEPTAAELAQVWVRNVLGLCRGARLELSDDDTAAVTGWVTGGLAPTSGA